MRKPRFTDKQMVAIVREAHWDQAASATKCHTCPSGRSKLCKNA